MNLAKLKIPILVTLMFSLLIMSCTEQNEVNSKFLGALGVIIGVFASANISKNG